MKAFGPPGVGGDRGPQAAALRKQTPPRLAEAAGRASCGLRRAQEPVTLALSGWADLAVWGPVTPWLAMQRRKLFRRLIPHQFSWRNVEKRAIFKHALEYEC